MFWKFGFQNASSIDTLLDRDDVALEHVLDEDDLLQECKAQNTRLIDYFQRVDVLQRLLGYVSGEVEGEERGRFKYPYVATEVLCSEIWSIVETCVNHSAHLLAPWWDYILDISPEDMRAKAALASHFAKINAVFLSKKPDEMLMFIQSQPSVVERLLAHIETPSFVDLTFRILQLDEHPGNMRVVEWLSSEKLIPQLVAMLSPSYTPEKHAVAAEFIKGIISLSAPSPGNFPLNPSAIGMMVGSDGLSPLPTSNRLARELGQEQNLQQLIRYMLDEVPIDAGPDATIKDDSTDEHLPSLASATSSLMNSISIFIELIRKNNSDYFEPHLFHTLRNRLIQIQQHMSYAHHRMESEEEERQVLEKAMAELVNHVGVVHLGSLLEVIGNRLKDFQRLLNKPRSSSQTIATTAGPVVPLTFERFRICELYAELLHCSNMSLLNRTAGVGPVYDEQGRLVGGLKALETLAKVISSGSAASDSPRSKHNDMDDQDDDQASSIDDGDSEEIGSDDVSDDISDEHEEPSPSTSASKPPEQSTENTSARSDKTVQPPTVPSTKATHDTPTTHLPSGDALKSRYLQLGIISTLLDLFFEFPLNNFLHNVVYDFLHQIITGRVDKGFNRELVISLFRDSRVLHRIIEAQRANDEACAKPKGVRLGYMGHLTLISEDIVSAFEQYPTELINILSPYMPQPQWEEYVSGKYKETKDKDTSQLGGGRPAIGLGVGPIAGLGGGTTSRQVDEGDFEARRATGSAGVSGGSSMTTEESEDGASSQFTQYLAQEIKTHDQFSSASTDSDDDDDDSGWLEAGNRDFHFSDGTGDFDLAAPPAILTRGQLAVGFEDAFDPGSAVANQENDSDEDAWGPFSDSAVIRDTTGSFSSSFTFSSTSDDDGFADSFGDDFGDFQAAGAANDPFESPQTRIEIDDDAGGRTPTAGTTTFGFESDFETTIFGSPSAQQGAETVTAHVENLTLRDQDNTSSTASAQPERVPLPPPSTSP